VPALPKIEFDIVYRTNFSADLIIIEEANELLERISDLRSVLPMLTSCCPAWVNYIEQSHPELIPNLSSCRSPQGMLSSLVKNYRNSIRGLKADQVLNVSIMPCTAKKDEIKRTQLRTKEGIKETDYILTVGELADLISH
jgi:iron only hydrogenase large subunit-like protein